MISVRSLRSGDVPQCEAILRGLPQWFGFEGTSFPLEETIAFRGRQQPTLLMVKPLCP